MSFAEDSPTAGYDSDVRVPIRFGLGTASLSLHDLTSIQPGFVFKLDRDATNPVLIEVNGATIGRGELLLVDGRLAVRFTEAANHANRSS